MFEFLELATAVCVIYQYFSDEPKTDDFLQYSSDKIPDLSPQERSLKWFMVRPEVLKKGSLVDSDILIVHEKQKHDIFRAVELLHRYANKLPKESSFKEKMLYAKKILPTCFFVSDHENMTDCKVIPFPRKKA